MAHLDRKKIAHGSLGLWAKEWLHIGLSWKKVVYGSPRLVEKDYLQPIGVFREVLPCLKLIGF